MSYYSRLYNHRNAQGPDTDKKPFFSKAQNTTQAQNKKSGFFQAKLAIGAPGDKYEKEADAVADKVISQPASRTNQPVVQKVSSVEHNDMQPENKRPVAQEQQMQMKSAIQKAGDIKEEEKAVQKVAEKEEDKIQKKDNIPEEEKTIVQKASEKEDDRAVQKAGLEKEDDKIQKKDELPKEEEKSVVQKTAEKEEEKPIVQKTAEKEKEKPVQKMDVPEKKEEEKATGAAVQAKQEGTATPASAQVATRIEGASGKGKFLPAGTLQEMNTSFGRDFSDVKVHNDGEAADLSQDLQAQAFTHGRDIYFNQGKFDPDSQHGKFLLAHELTHVVQQGASQPAENVQRKKIDHRTLVWPDFMGKVPKRSAYDAATLSNISEFDSSKYPFKPLVATPTGTTAHVGSKDIDCEKGMAKDKRSSEHPEKYKAFSVDITADAALITAKAYMWQEKSWARPWTTDPKAREAKAAKEISNCKTGVSKRMSKIDAQCNKLVNDCRKHIKATKGGEYTVADSTATNMNECASLVKPACVTNAQQSISFTYKNQNGVEASASQLADCNTTFKQQMVDVVLEDSSNSLLNHEQRHFDITNQLAGQLTDALRTKAAGFADKKVEACTESGALQAAAKLIAKHKKELDSVEAKFRKKLVQMQNAYDNETKHGTISKAQDWWGTNIDAGLPDKSGRGNF